MNVPKLLPHLPQIWLSLCHALFLIIIPPMQNAKMHENAAESSKSECDSLLLADPDNNDGNGEDAIEIIVATMENGNHTADLPRRTQQQVSFS